jgi:tripartite-type tricarboxylate transporter receptor subunit TctC
MRKIKLSEATGLVCLAITSTFIVPVQSLAQTYPVKPVRILIPFGPGSTPDLVARVVAERASTTLGQPVISENRVGAGGRIASEAVSRAAPDGYTLLLGSTSTHVLGPLLVKSTPYDPVKDFSPISIATMPVSGFIVHSSVPANSMKELLQFAKANPGRLAYGSNGIGSSHHLAGELIKLAAGIDMLHVPLAGSNEVLAGVLANHVQVSFSSPGNAKSHLASGRLKLLSVITPKRDPGNPDVPTLAEALPGYSPMADWFAFFGPGGLPNQVVTRLNTEVVKALNVAEAKAKLEGASQLIIASSSAELADTLKREAAAYASIIKAAKIPIQ